MLSPSQVSELHRRCVTQGSVLFKACFSNCTTTVLCIFTAEDINLISVMPFFSDLHGKNWLTPNTSTNCYSLLLNYKRITKSHYHSKSFACGYYFYLSEQCLFHSWKQRIKTEMDKNLTFPTEMPEPRLWKCLHCCLSYTYPTDRDTQTGQFGCWFGQRLAQHSPTDVVCPRLALLLQRTTCQPEIGTASLWQFALTSAPVSWVGLQKNPFLECTESQFRSCTR